MLGLLLALAAGQLDGGVADAGELPVVILDVVRGDLLVREESDGGVAWREVDEGCYAPTESCMRIAKQKARKEAELREANEQSAKWVAVAFGSGTVVGVAIGVVIGIFAMGKPK